MHFPSNSFPSLLYLYRQRFAWYLNEISTEQIYIRTWNTATKTNLNNKKSQTCHPLQDRKPKKLKVIDGVFKADLFERVKGKNYDIIY